VLLIERLKMCEVNNTDDVRLLIKKFDIQKKELKETNPKLYSKIEYLLNKIEKSAKNYINDLDIDKKTNID
jgi:hypothetical protein